jgi:hypothetical protein
MKLTLKTLFVITLAFGISITSCKKKSTEPTPEEPAAVVPITPPPAASFLWQEDGGAIITADSSYWTTGTWGTGVRAYKGGLINFFEINWSTINNISVGVKILNPLNYGFTFLKSASTYTCATNQNLNITATATTTISGNFNVPVVGGPISTISATFTSLPKRY